MRGGPRNELAWGDVTSRAGSGSQGVVVHHDAARQGGVQEHDSLRANAPEAQGTGEVEGAPDSRRDRCVGVPALSRERRRPLQTMCAQLCLYAVKANLPFEVRRHGATFTIATPEEILRTSLSEKLAFLET